MTLIGRKQKETLKQQYPYFFPLVDGIVRSIKLGFERSTPRRAATLTSTRKDTTARRRAQQGERPQQGKLSNYGDNTRPKRRRYGSK